MRELDCEESWAPENWCLWTMVLEKTLESPLDCNEIQLVQPNRDQFGCSLQGLMLKLKLRYFATPCEELTHWKRPWFWERLKQEEKGTTENEMVGWHHWLNGHEFEQAPEVGDGQGSLVCCSPWCHKELDTTEWLNWTELTENSSISQSSKEWYSMPFQDKEASKLWNSIWAVAMEQDRKRLLASCKPRRVTDPDDSIRWQIQNKGKGFVQ